MSKQLGAITTSYMGPTLNQVSGGDTRDHIDKSKSDFLRQPGLSRDFHGTNAAEIFHGHEISRRSQPRHLYDGLNSKNLVCVQKIEEDSSDGHMTQDSNDTSDDATGPNKESTSFRQNSASNLKTGDPLTPRSTCDLLMPSRHEGLSSSSINPYNVSPDSHFFIPVHQLNSRLMSSIPSNLLPSGMSSSSSQMNEEASRKRQLRLLKNKEAAKECRRKKKEYVKCLENRVAVLENQNKTLIEELKSLKELYCQKEVQG